MKKIFFAAAAGLVLTTAVCVTLSSNSASVKPDLVLQNIEAISQGESGVFYCTGYPIVVICVGDQSNILDTGYRVYL